MRCFIFAGIGLVGSLAVWAQPSVDSNGRQFMAETPDAIVCLFNNPQKTRFIYRKTSGALGDLVRYDGPEGFLLHYALPSGALMHVHNPQPAGVDCVSEAITLQQLIKKQRAYQYLTPMPGSEALHSN